MALLVRNAGRHFLFKNQTSLVNIKKRTTSTAYDEMKAYWSKNAKLQRPISPHLTIYRYQLPMNMSLAHRATGMILATSISASAIGLLVMQGDFASYLQMVKDMPYGMLAINTDKFIIAWTFVFHFLNGIRHLAWDAALGFKIPTMYKSGWTVTILSLVLTIMIVMYKPKQD